MAKNKIKVKELKKNEIKITITTNIKTGQEILRAIIRITDAESKK